MVKGLITEQYLKDIGDAIREKTGENSVYYPSEMADKILSIQTGGGGLDLETSIILSSDVETTTTGNVTLNGILKANYDDLTPADIDLDGYLKNAPVKLYNSDDELLDTQLTDNNGVVTFNETITEDTTFYAQFDGTSDYNSCESNEVTVEYINWRDTYQEVEWIGSTGTQYIDTGLIGTNNIGFEISFTTSEPLNTSGKTIFGSRESYNRNGYQLTAYTEVSSMKGHFLYGPSRYNVDMKNDGTLNVIKFNPPVLTTAADVTTTLPSITVTTPVNLTIFCLSERYSRNEYSHTKLYSLKFYENSTIIRDFVPVYDKNTGEIGLYDKINNVFYTNDGAGVFDKGADVN